MDKCVLKLFVTGRSARSDRAIANVRRLCEGDLDGRCELQVIDVLDQPHLAEEEKILATPTLVKQFPPPALRIIGDLSDQRRVLASLDIAPIQGLGPSH